MAGAEPRVSVDKAALGASLPGATGHLLSRLLFRWLLLPAAIVLPAGGAAGLAWRLAHLRASAADVAAAQAAVEKATDEAEAEVDEALRSETDPDVRVADAARARIPGVTSKAELDAIAGVLAALQKLPSRDEAFRLADEAQRQGHWQEAASLYEGIAIRYELSDPRTSVTAWLAKADMSRVHDIDLPGGAWAGYIRAHNASRKVSPELAAEVDRALEAARPHKRR